MLKNFSSANARHLHDHMRLFFPMHMVRPLILTKVRMRELNTKRAVPLDAVLERRTKRFPPRFRPVGSLL